MKAPCKHAHTWATAHRDVRKAIALLRAHRYSVDALQAYDETLDLNRYEETGRTFKEVGYVAPSKSKPSLSQLRAAVEKALCAVRHLPHEVWDEIKDPAIYELESALLSITDEEREQLRKEAAALGFKDLGPKMGWDNLMVGAPVSAPGELLLDGEQEPRQLLAFQVKAKRPSAPPLTTPGDRYLVELGHPETSLRFGLATHYPVDDSGRYPGAPASIRSTYPELFDGSSDVLVFKENKDDLVEYTPAKALALLRR